MQFLIVGLGAGEYGNATKPLLLENLWEIPEIGIKTNWRDIEEKPETFGSSVYRKKGVILSVFAWNYNFNLNKYVYSLTELNITENSSVVIIPVATAYNEEVVIGAGISPNTPIVGSLEGSSVIIYANQNPADNILVDVLITDKLIEIENSKTGGLEPDRK